MMFVLLESIHGDLHGEGRTSIRRFSNTGHWNGKDMNMKKTLLILAATLAVTSSAFARPCRGYRRPCRRPVVVEHHHYHKSHCWHSEDWGKLAAGIAVGWLFNEACDTTPRQEVVYNPPPAYQPPVYTPEPIYQPSAIAPAPSYQTTVVREPVVRTVTRAPRTTIVTTPCTPPAMSVVQNNTTIQVIHPTTIVRQIAY